MKKALPLILAVCLLAALFAGIGAGYENPYGQGRIVAVSPEG